MVTEVCVLPSVNKKSVFYQYPNGTINALSIRKKDPRHDDRTAVHKTRLSLAWLYCLPSQDMYTPSLLKVH